MKIVHAVAMVLAMLFSADSLAEPAIKGPAAYLEHFTGGEKVLWIGEVVDAKAYRKGGEVAIEWLCRYLELAEPLDIDVYLDMRHPEKAKPPIKVRRTNQYFVTTLRSPDMPLDVAQQNVAAVKNSKQFALREAETDFIGTFKGRRVVYIGGGRGMVTSNLKFVYVK